MALPVITEFNSGNLFLINKSNLLTSPGDMEEAILFALVKRHKLCIYVETV